MATAQRLLNSELQRLRRSPPSLTTPSSISFCIVNYWVVTLHSPHMSTAVRLGPTSYELDGSLLLLWITSRFFDGGLLVFLLSFLPSLASIPFSSFLPSFLPALFLLNLLVPWSHTAPFYQYPRIFLWALKPILYYRCVFIIFKTNRKEGT